MKVKDKNCNLIRLGKSSLQLRAHTTIKGIIAKELIPCGVGIALGVSFGVGLGTVSGSGIRVGARM